MPKQTFLNLPQEKRNTIVDAAVAEFSEYGFEGASINRIVTNSGIAKGSFYQYFEDKMDVFRHLIDLLAQEKTEFFKDKHPPNMGQGVFEYFRWLLKTGLEFNSVNPRMTQAVARILFREGLFYGPLFRDYQQQTKEALTGMIRHAIELGEVDPSVDLELAVMVMEIWTNAITTYILDEGMKQEDILAWVRSSETQEKIDKLLYVMEYGLRKTESEFKPSVESSLRT